VFATVLKKDFTRRKNGGKLDTVLKKDLQEGKRWKIRYCFKKDFRRRKLGTVLKKDFTRKKIRYQVDWTL